MGAEPLPSPEELSPTELRFAIQDGAAVANVLVNYCGTRILILGAGPSIRDLEGALPPSSSPSEAPASAALPLLQLALPFPADSFDAPSLDAILVCSSSALVALPLLLPLAGTPKVFSTDAALRLGPLQLEEASALAQSSLIRDTSAKSGSESFHSNQATQEYANQATHMNSNQSTQVKGSYATQCNVNQANQVRSLLERLREAAPLPSSAVRALRSMGLTCGDVPESPERQWHPMPSQEDIQRCVDLVRPLRLREEADLGTGVSVVPFPAGAHDLGCCSWQLKGPLGPLIPSMAPPGPSRSSMGPLGPSGPSMGSLGASSNLAVLHPGSSGLVLSAEADVHVLDGCSKAVLLGAPQQDHNEGKLAKSMVEAVTVKRCKGVLVPLQSCEDILDLVQDIATKLEPETRKFKILYISPAAERIAALLSALPEWTCKAARVRMLAGRPMHKLAEFMAKGKLVCGCTVDAPGIRDALAEEWSLKIVLACHMSRALSTFLEAAERFKRDKAWAIIHPEVQHGSSTGQGTSAFAPQILDALHRPSIESITAPSMLSKDPSFAPLIQKAHFVSSTSPSLTLPSVDAKGLAQTGPLAVHAIFKGTLPPLRPVTGDGAVVVTGGQALGVRAKGEAVVWVVEHDGKWMVHGKKPSHGSFLESSGAEAEVEGEVAVHGFGESDLHAGEHGHSRKKKKHKHKHREDHAP